MIDWLQAITEWYMQNINYWNITVCMTIESSFIPFPAELIVPPAAWKAANGELNIVLVILFSTIGSVAGALINYTIALLLGRKLIYSFTKTRIGHLLMKTEQLEKAENYFLKHGKTATLIGRLTPGVRSFISFPPGLVKMPVSDFILYTFIGAGIWNILLAMAGYFLYTQKELLHTYITDISIVMLTLAIVFICTLRIRNRKRKNGNPEK